MTTSASQGTSSAPQIRPSLYAAIRLARLVLQVKERLKARVKSARLPTKPSVICQRNNFSARTFNDYATRARSGGSIFALPYRRPKHVQGRELQVPALLHALDTYTLPGDSSIMMAAEQDELFLKQNPQNRIKGSNRVGLCNIFDLTTLLLGRLQHLSGSDGRTQGSDHKNNRTGWVGSICHKTVANLEHLLRCLQRASLEALISDKLKIIEAEISGWHQYWQLSRTIFQGWFSEWPNGQRPLNTTWPWNVRPSLVVLWGVCWMFFDDHSTRRTRKPPPPQPRPSIYPQQPVANSSLWDSLDSLYPWQIPSLPDWVVTSPSTNAWTSQYIQQPTSENTDYLASSEPASQYKNLYFDPRAPNLGGYEDSTGHLNFLDLETTPQRIRAQGTVEPDDQKTQPPHIDKGQQGNGQTGPRLAVPGHGMKDYPTPHSEVSDDRPTMPKMALSSTEGSPSPGKGKVVAISDPEIDEKGVYHCSLEECANKPREFIRKCEYTKHRDKHTRPHICKVPGCEKIQGFTYAGGLLRHEREVHGQHGGPKAFCLCPHPNCKRSSGAGFTRRENLSEHLRRVHRQDSDGRDAATLPIKAGFSTSVLPPSTENPRKRRRRDDSEDDSEDGQEERKLLQKQVKEMRKDLDNADERLKRLEQLVEKLSAALRTAASN